MTASLLLAAAASLAPVTPGLPAPDRVTPRSPMALARDAHPYDPEHHALPLTSDFTPAPDGRTLDRVVYGYLPYWATDGVVVWRGLSHLSYFDAPIDADGTLAAAGTTRLASARYSQLKADAATARKTFTITFTNFSDSEIAGLVGTYRATTVATIADTVAAHGAGGANIDFETVPAASRADFTAFVQALRIALDAKVPGAHLTLATPMIDWSDAYDFAALADATDGLMVMVYGCAWGGASRAGPVSPLDRTTKWGRCSLGDTLDTYLADLGDARRHKFIAGLPWYGFRWQTASDAVGAATQATGTSQFWNACRTLIDTHGARWDEDAMTSWTTWTESGKTYQAWCDDPEAFDLRLQRIVSKDVAGLGIWALTYEGSDARWWDAILRNFGSVAVTNHPPVASAGDDQDVRAGDLVALDGTRSRDPDGDRLTWKWTQVAGAPLAFDPVSPAPVFAVAEEGSYGFELVVNDGAFDSAPDRVAIHVTPATVVDGGDGGGGGEAPGCGCSGGPATLFPLAAVFRIRRKSSRNP